MTSTEELAALMSRETGKPAGDALLDAFRSGGGVDWTTAGDRSAHSSRRARACLHGNFRLGHEHL